MKRFPQLILLLGVLLSLGFAPRADVGETEWERQFRLLGKINLVVPRVLQSRYTSCGEAAITMAYNYARPQAKVTEEKVIEFALSRGYFIENEPPFTSPAAMVEIAKYYADDVSTGHVKTADEGLALLTDKLTSGNPVIIDSRARLYDLESVAHFVVVTGLVLDDENPNKTKIIFNDPITGTNRWGYWLGIEGVWNAWQNNGDPDGSGWWMVIPSS